MGTQLTWSLFRFEYVKGFEQPDQLLPNTWIVVRIDGRGFTKYALADSLFPRGPIAHAVPFS